MVVRANIPAELDVLDSPLLDFGQSPLASAMFGRLPGSALAERIFNDPSAWETSSELGHDESEDEGVEITFDVEGLDKEEVETAKMARATPPTKESKAQLLASPPTFGLHGRAESLPMGIKRRTVRPISLASLFQHGSEDAFLKNVQSNLRKFSNEGGTERTPATADIFSPMTDSTGTPGTANTDLSMLSPSPLYSASTTLSFLDLYLDSPKLNMRKSLYAKRQSQAASKFTPALVIPQQSIPTSGLALTTPLSARPDMTVEPSRRTGSVPPLEQLSNDIPTPTATCNQLSEQQQKTKLPPPPPTSVLSPEPKPSLPPGLVHPASKAVASLQPKTMANKENVNVARSLPKPVAPQQNSSEQQWRPSTSLPRPPPYSRTPSPPHPSVAPNTRAESPSPAGASLSRASSKSSVRKLPTIPLKSAAALHSAAAASASALAPSTGRPAASPLLSSLPTSVLSPEPTPGAQTIMFHSRLAQSVRSPPLSGPMGPRSKADRNSRNSPSPSAKRVGNGCKVLAASLRRPPGLQL